MKNWIEKLTESELETIRATLVSSVKNNQIGFNTRQNAQIILEEIDDFIWDSVCKNIPTKDDEDN
jgi:hypothetical protein